MGKGINAVMLVLLGSQTAGAGEFQSLQRLFSSPGGLQEAPKPENAAPEAAVVLYEKVIPLKEIKNNHYSTDFKAVLGKDKTEYSLSGQEEKPEGFRLFGAMTLLIGKNGQNPDFFELDALKNQSRQHTLGGSLYEISYEPRGLRPDQGKIFLTALEKGQQSHEIQVINILEAVYKRSKSLQKVPLRIGYFTKLAKLKNQNGPEENWIMLLRDGLKTEDFEQKAGNISDFKRLHVDTANLPVNQPEDPVWKTLRVSFDGYSVELSSVQQIKGDKTEEYLHIKVSK